MSEKENCGHCGAGYNLHHAETDQCPENGREAALYSPTHYLETKYIPRTLKLQQDAAPDLYIRLESATRFIIAERDCYCDSISLEDGSIPDDADRAELARLDAEIDANQKALKKARGEA